MCRSAATAPILLTQNDLALTLKISGRTLRAWRAQGKTPPPDISVGRTVRWLPETIIAWAEGRVPQLSDNCVADELADIRPSAGGG